SIVWWWFIHLFSVFFFFFFQAEDGIRDATVTGVQTCALPISRGNRQQGAGRSLRRGDLRRDENSEGGDGRHGRWVWRKRLQGARSEERRVGKECRAGWCADAVKEEESDDRAWRDNRDEGMRVW